MIIRTFLFCYFRTLSCCSDIESLSFSPDGNFLASGGWENRVYIVYIWDVVKRTATPPSTDHNNRAVYWSKYNLAGRKNVTSWSPNSSILASAGGDGKINLWDWEKGKLINELKSSDNPIRALAWSPDGKFLASGGSEKAILIWDIKTGKIVNHLVRHADSVIDLAWSFDGKFLASCSIFNSIILWDMDKKKVKQYLNHGSTVYSLAWSPTNNTLASGDGNGIIKFWKKTPLSQIN